MKAQYITSNLANLLVKYIQLKGPSQQAGLLSGLTSELQRYQANEPLSYQQWCQYLAELSNVYNKPELGIELGELAEAEHGGILAYLTASCDNLGEALMRFERFQSLLYGSEAKVIADGDNIVIRWQPEVEPTLGTQLSDEVLIIGLACFINRVIGQQVTMPQVTFIHSEPDYSQAYQPHLGNNLHFDCSTLSVEFPKHYLALPINNSEPALKTILDQQAEALLQDSSPSQQECSTTHFNQQVKSELSHCLNESKMTLDDLASRMKLSPRTLHRRLQDQGSNFKQRLKETRLELAIAYLDEGKLSLTEISHKLGYTEQSTFSRAFKQWTGNTPREYLGKKH